MGWSRLGVGGGGLGVRQLVGSRVWGGFGLASQLGLGFGLGFGVGSRVGGRGGAGVGMREAVSLWEGKAQLQLFA